MLIVAGFRPDIGHECADHHPQKMEMRIPKNIDIAGTCFFDYTIKMPNLVSIQSCDYLFTKRSHNETIRKGSPDFLA